MPKHERMYWRGQLVTIVERKGRKVTVRDAFGFRWTVPKRELSPLAEDDERRTFST